MLLDYEGDVEQEMALTFEAAFEEFGHMRTVQLKENGASIPVTTQNRGGLNHAYHHTGQPFLLG